MDKELNLDLELDIEPEEDQSRASKALGVGLGGLQAVSKVRNLPYNLTTGALANQILSFAAKDPEKAKQLGIVQNYMKALNPTTVDQPPSLSEALELAGVKEGAKASDVFPGPFETVEDGSQLDRWYVPNVGGPMDVTIRGAGGTVVQEFIDPLNWLTAGATTGTGSALDKVIKAAAKVQHAPAAAARGMGKKLFTSGVRPVIEAGKKLTKDEEVIIDTLLKHGVTGATNRSFFHQSEDALAKVGAQHGDILEGAAARGVTIPQKEINQGAYDAVRNAWREQRIKGTTRREAGREARAIYNDLASPGTRSVNADVPVNRVSKWKTDEQSAMGEGAFDPLKNAPKNRVRSDIDADYEKNMRGLISKAVPEIDPVNSEYGALKAVTKKARNAQGKSALPLTMGPADLFAAMGSYGVGGPFASVEALLAMQAGRLAFKTPGGQRFLGSRLHDLGSSWKKYPTNAATWSLLRKPNAPVGGPDPSFDLDLEEKK